ncbi:DUF6038 family protein [Staphylococcus cohnii]|uniref:Uncharacterized protein n=2 Tax=Staphylococcus cohnii TaxID=29382 RepID=A0A0M2NTN8_STACC|nr:DUF6038 family protein [Staphylococcus cohnii]TGP64681.1 hypothetical protein EN872_02105 [bacterium M00.F.Ca.ET.229.01.1.1]TGS41175.1 hypothetical protein EN823_02105 [bacterium M00.F.Ca.ET.180.01.1.1]KKI63086.1 hypothetical protein UF66_1192 [Staphylococcus cohnii subsp. cohnii]OIS37256.1 hypothetical protein RES13_09365 [Staphylococcus cohnii]OIS38631.1 hypothetical protein RES11_01770 [Staphylococcus cohnii]
MSSNEIVRKLYSKEDIRIELELTPHKFNKKMDTISNLFKIDMKNFHNYKGQDINNQYTFNGVAKELIKVLLKSIDYYPVDINSKNFKQNGKSKKEMIENINASSYMEYTYQLMKSINEIKYKRLIADIHMKDVYQNTKAWLSIGESINKKEQELYQYMKPLPLHKRIELQNEVLKSIDETIFQFMAKEHRNNQIEENDELGAYIKGIKEDKDTKNDYELNHLLYKKNQLPIDTLIKDMWDYDETEHIELDWLIVDMLKRSQRADIYFKESLDKKNKLRKNIHKDSIKNISKLIDHELLKSNHRWDILSFYKSYQFWNNIKLNRDIQKYNVLYYKNNNLSIENQSAIIKKIKTIEANLENANKQSSYLDHFLQAKFDLEKLESELMKYNLNPKYIDKINDDFIRYAIEDVHNAIIKIDRYISTDEVNLNYSNIQMVVRNEIKEQGSFFVTQTLNTLSKVEESDCHFDNFMVGPFVENFKRAIKNRRFGMKTK